MNVQKVILDRSFSKLRRNSSSLWVIYVIWNLLKIDAESKLKSKWRRKVAENKTKKKYKTYFERPQQESTTTQFWIHHAISRSSQWDLTTELNLNDSRRRLWAESSKTKNHFSLLFSWSWIVAVSLFWLFLHLSSSSLFRFFFNKRTKSETCENGLERNVIIFLSLSRSSLVRYKQRFFNSTFFWWIIFNYLLCSARLTHLNTLKMKQTSDRVSFTHKYMCWTLHLDMTRLSTHQKFRIRRDRTKRDEKQHANLPKIFARRRRWLFSIDWLTFKR